MTVTAPMVVTVLVTKIAIRMARFVMAMKIALVKASSNANRTEVVAASKMERRNDSKTAAAATEKIATVTETVQTAMVKASASRSAIATVTALKAKINSKSASAMEVDARTMKTVTAMVTAIAPEKVSSRIRKVIVMATARKKVTRSANGTEVALERRVAVREFVEESRSNCMNRCRT